MTDQDTKTETAVITGEVKLPPTLQKIDLVKLIVNMNSKRARALRNLFALLLVASQARSVEGKPVNPINCEGGVVLPNKVYFDNEVRPYIGPETRGEWKDPLVLSGFDKGVPLGVKFEKYDDKNAYLDRQLTTGDWVEGVNKGPETNITVYYRAPGTNQNMKFVTFQFEGRNLVDEYCVDPEGNVFTRASRGIEGP